MEENKMRILANYGYRANGDTYSVTFETIGDVPRENADGVVDELFSMAKEAIKRQLNPGDDSLEFPPKDEVVIPKPKKNTNSNGSALSAANGRPIVLKDPEAPASKKQKSLIIRLARERGQFIDNLNDLTMKEASETIDELMATAV